MAYEEDLDEAVQDTIFTLDLHTAASLGDMDLIMTLETDLNTKNMSQWTALMYACFYDHQDLVSFLLNRGAIVIGSKNDIGRTPLMLSVMCGNTGIARLLLRKFGSPLLQEKDRMGFTPLLHAVHCNQDSSVQLLLEAGANPNVTENIQGYSPLMKCVMKDNSLTRKIACLLVQYGADVAYTNILGENAKTLSCKYGHEAMIYILNKSAKLPVFDAPSVLNGPAKLAVKISKQMESSQTPCRDLDGFLKLVGLDRDHYMDLFDKNNVKFEQLIGFGEEELKLIGVEKMGPRKKMVMLLKRLKSDNSSISIESID